MLDIANRFPSSSESLPTPPPWGFCNSGSLSHPSPFLNLNKLRASPWPQTTAAHQEPGARENKFFSTGCASPSVPGCLYNPVEGQRDCWESPINTKPHALKNASTHKTRLESGLAAGCDHASRCRLSPIDLPFQNQEKELPLGKGPAGAAVANAGLQGAVLLRASQLVPPPRLGKAPVRRMFFHLQLSPSFLLPPQCQMSASGGISHCKKPWGGRDSRDCRTEMSGALRQAITQPSRSLDLFPTWAKSCFPLPASLPFAAQMCKASGADPLRLISPPPIFNCFIFVYPARTATVFPCRHRLPAAALSAAATVIGFRGLDSDQGCKKERTVGSLPAKRDQTRARGETALLWGRSPISRSEKFGGTSQLILEEDARGHAPPNPQPPALRGVN